MDSSSCTSPIVAPDIERTIVLSSLFSSTFLITESPISSVGFAM